MLLCPIAPNAPTTIEASAANTTTWRQASAWLPNASSATRMVSAIAATQGALLETVMQTAREIASKSPLAIAGTKEILRYSRDHSVEDGLRYVATWQAGMLFTSDIIEQIVANQEKRSPAFADLLPERRIGGAG